MKEGESLRLYFKRLPTPMGEIATELGMTRQGLNYHLRKEVLDDDFKRLLKEKYGIQFNENKLSIIHTKNEAAFIDLGDQLIMQVPLVNQYAYAGYLSGYADQEYLDDLPKVPWLVDKEHKGTYLTFEVKNDSMYDGTVNSYMEGDKVLAREIQRHHWQSKLHIDNWDFVIVHRTDGILLKKIAEHNTEKGTLTLHSLNPMYDDFMVNLDDLVQIFNVVQVSRKK